MNLKNLDLTLLMRQRHFTHECELSMHGRSYATKALIDSGAFGFAYITPSLVGHFSRLSTPLPMIPLPKCIDVKGYDGKVGGVVSHYVRLTLRIDQRCQILVPFFVLNCGNLDIILGQGWLSTFGIRLDCARQRLIWPENLPPTNDQPRNIPLPRQPFRYPDIDPKHQADVYRREELLDMADARRRAGKNKKADAEEKEIMATYMNTFSLACSTPLDPMLSHLRSGKSPLGAIEREQERDRLRRASHLKLQETRMNLDIGPNDAHLFHFNCKQKGNVLFSTSLYEIDRLIEDATSARQQNLWRSLQQMTPSPMGKSTLQIFAAEEDVSKVPNAYRDFIDVFSKEDSNVLPPNRPYDHKIILEGEGEAALRYSPLYKMSAEELSVVKQYITENLAKGFIEPSQAPFAAPVLFVAKPDGGLRFCIDYRQLNQLTRKDRYPLPLIDETLARISKAKIFTKLDIRQAFHRIRMDPASEELTTFRTRYGAYKCKVLPFGLTNGPATYQRYMNDVLFDLLDVMCTAYLDDILIYSEEVVDHEQHVKQVLQRLRDAGLQADIKKSEFSVTRTKYLGFIISTNGIEVDPSKVDVVKEWKPPVNVRGVQSFLGFCNFYRRFIRNYGILAKPLTNLTRTGVPFVFDHECFKAFSSLKAALTSAPLLQHYHQDLPCQLETDASDGIVAGVLSQQHGDQWHPVAYFSKTMAPAELNYEIHDKEMLAIVLALKEWRVELVSTPGKFKIFTDHKALEYFMSSKKLNARQARWAELLADYAFMISYRPGKDNQAADALTRREDEVQSQTEQKQSMREQTLLGKDKLDPDVLSDLSHTPPDLCAFEATTHQETAPISALVERILEANRNAKSLDALRAQARSSDEKDFALRDKLLLYKGRVVVPDVDHLRLALIREAHDNVFTAHPKVAKTCNIVSNQYYWKGLTTTVSRYVANCRVCRRANTAHDKQPGLLQPLPVPNRPWEHITVDFCSFPPDKKGYDNVLVFVDRLSKQAISVPCMKDVDSRELARLYIYHVYRYHGPALSIVSDRGPQFVSEFWRAFNHILGTTISLSTADHPQTDGQTEIYNKYLQRRLRPFVSYYQDNWSDLLPLMDYAQLTLPHSSLDNMTPYEVLHGYKARNSWDWSYPNSTPKNKVNVEDAKAVARAMREAQEFAKSAILKAQGRMRAAVDPHRRKIDFNVGDMVYLDGRNLRTGRPSKKLDNPTRGPFPIIEKVGTSFRLQLPASYKIHNVFPPERLRRSPEDPLEGQEQVPEEPINITGENEYEVDRILGVRLVKKTLRYRVKWLGWDEDPEEYDATDLMYSPKELRRFHMEYPNLPGPPAMLPKWLEAYDRGDDVYDDLDSSAPMDKRSRASFFERGG